MGILLQQYGSIVSDFLAIIPTGAEARSRRLMMKLENEGGSIRTPDSKSLGDGLFELRPSYKGNEYRLVYFFFEGAAVFVECFVKKRRKTPHSKLEISKRRKAEIERGGKANEITVH